MPSSVPGATPIQATDEDFAAWMRGAVETTLNGFTQLLDVDQKTRLGVMQMVKLGFPHITDPRALVEIAHFVYEG